MNSHGAMGGQGSARLLSVCVITAFVVACALGLVRAGNLAADIDARPIAAVELREGASWVSVYKAALVYAEGEGGDAPDALGFVPDPRYFKPLSSLDQLSPRSGDKAVWLAFSVRSAASARSWLLSVGPPSVPRLALWSIAPNGRVDETLAGSHDLRAARAHGFSDYVFRLTLAPGELRTLYLRVAARPGEGVRAALWDALAFARYDALGAAFAGIFAGVMLALFAYAAFVSLPLRDRAYYFHFLFLVGLFGEALVTSGAGRAILWRDAFDSAASSLFASLMAAGGMLFTREYLGERLKPRLLSIALVAYPLVLPFALGAILLAGPRFGPIGARYLLLGMLGLCLAAALASGLRSERRARVLAAAWASAFTGAVLSFLPRSLASGPYLEFALAQAALAGLLAAALIFIFGIAGDLAQAKREREAAQLRSIALLERANRVKEDFLFRIGLDVGGPLFGILGLVERLERRKARRGGAEGDEEDRLLALARAETERLLNLVRNIEAYARIRNRDLVLSAEPIPLREAIEEIVNAASYLAAEKDLVTSVEVEDAELLSDVRAFHQILYTVLVTALRASDSGRVAVSAGLRGDQVQIVVLDAAPPLPAEVVARVFHGQPDEAEELGPGLELLVARRLAELLGGSLSYRYDNGSGRYTCALARRAPFADAAAPRERRRRRDEGRGRYAAVPAHVADDARPGDRALRGAVLAASSDPVFLEAMRGYLEERGYAVTAVSSVRRAADLIEAGSDVDIVILDGAGGGMPDLEAFARIRRVRPLGELPVLAMTDRDHPEDAAFALRAGADDYLPRLSPPEILYARIDARVALKRAVAEILETRRRVAELDKLKTLGVLSAGLAHEINTPNNAVLRNVPILAEVWREIQPMIGRYREEYGDFNIRGWSADEVQAEVPELLADTYDAGRQIKKIVEDLKEYARAPENAEFEEVDLAEVAAYAARLLGPAVEKATKRFSIEAEKPLLPVRADFRKLTQVVVNLLENALAALPGPEAAVRLRVYVEDQSPSSDMTPRSASRPRVILECCDEGVGIPSELLGRIFEPFFTTKRERGGSGLGLPVSLGIVRECGGDLEIGPAPGGGTLARLSLPAAVEAPQKEMR